MNRKLKNILMIAAVLILCGAMAFTMITAKNSVSANMQNMSASNSESMGTPPDGTGNNEGTQSGETQQQPQNSDGQQLQNGETPPEKPDGDNSTDPSQMADSNTAQGQAPSAQDGQTPPEKPDGSTNSENGTDGQVPEKPNDSTNSENGTGGQMPENNATQPDGQMPEGSQQNTAGSLSTIYYILFGVEGLLLSALVIYLILSGMNKKTFKETFSGKKQWIIAIACTIVLTAGITFGAAAFTQKVLMQTGQTQGQQGQQADNSTSDSAASASTVDGSTETLNGTYESTESDVSAVLVKNGGTATITGATINKSAGDSSNTENSEFYGINAALLVTKNSTASIKNAAITTAAKGANAVFATGENAKITISDSTITSTGSSSARGLDATYGGTIEADNVTITTQGGSCATLATDRGEGTVSAKNSSLTTNGAGSPLIYSTGNISVEETTGTANGAQIAVIEGKNTATVESSKLNCSAAGNRGDVDIAGVMIYQSMSGDASEGTGTFTAANSELSILSSSGYYQSAPMFFVTNTDAVINLENTTLNYGSNILLSAKGTDEWGKSGSNGGNVTLTAKNQTLKGNIVLDSLSTLSLNLTASSYEGTINADQSAKSIKLTLDKNSKIKLTGNSYVTELENADTSNSNIDFNGYTLYVNGTAIN